MPWSSVKPSWFPALEAEGSVEDSCFGEIAWTLDDAEAERTAIGRLAVFLAGGGIATWAGGGDAYVFCAVRLCGRDWLDVILLA